MLKVILSLVIAAAMLPSVRDQEYHSLIWAHYHEGRLKLYPIGSIVSVIDIPCPFGVTLIRPDGTETTMEDGCVYCTSGDGLGSYDRITSGVVRRLPSGLVEAVMYVKNP
jgi:hypothetical protein